jgi:hypothetical protein
MRLKRDGLMSYHIQGVWCRLAMLLRAQKQASDDCFRCRRNQRRLWVQTEEKSGVRFRFLGEGS